MVAKPHREPPQTKGSASCKAQIEHFIDNLKTPILAFKNLAIHISLFCYHLPLNVVFPTAQDVTSRNISLLSITSLLPHAVAESIHLLLCPLQVAESGRVVHARSVADVQRSRKEFGA